MVPAESVDDGLCILFYYSVLPVWQSAAQRGVSAASTTCSRCSVGVAFRAGPPPPPIVESQLHTPPPYIQDRPGMSNYPVPWSDVIFLDTMLVP